MIIIAICCDAFTVIDNIKIVFKTVWYGRMWFCVSMGPDKM